MFLTINYAFDVKQSSDADFMMSLTDSRSDNNSDCITDELYGDFTDVEYNNLVIRRNNVRELMKKMYLL